MSHVTNLPLGQGPEMIQEHWVRFFCEKEEFKQIIAWLHQEGLSRPVDLDERLAHAEKLREMGKGWYKKGDLRRALHCLMGAVHTLDMAPSEQMALEPQMRLDFTQSMMPVMANLAAVFMNRGDFVNCDKAATAGLRCAAKLPDEETRVMRAKLLYRRGLARGQDDKGGCRDLEGARDDLVEAAKLEPTDREIRACLAKCKELILEERKQDPLRYRLKKDSPEEEESTADGAGGELAEPPELPPWLDKVAMVIGRSLGACLRTYRHLREGRVLVEAQQSRWVIIAVLAALMAVVVGLLLR